MAYVCYSYQHTSQSLLPQLGLVLSLNSESKLWAFCKELLN